nr:immunoglobulin heavy chain junction region [Macaca mulatta]
CARYGIATGRFDFW